MTVQIRNHRQEKFKSLLEQKIKLKAKFEYDGKGPVMTVYKEDKQPGKSTSREK